jgi:WD40 repeat protein
MKRKYDQIQERESKRIRVVERPRRDVVVFLERVSFDVSELYQLLRTKFMTKPNATKWSGRLVGRKYKNDLIVYDTNEKRTVATMTDGELEDELSWFDMYRTTMYQLEPDIICIRYKNTITVWNIREQKLLFKTTTTYLVKSVERIAENILALSCGEVQVWNYSTGKLLYTLSDDRLEDLSEMLLLQDGTLACALNTIFIWDLTKKSIIKTLSCDDFCIYSLAQTETGLLCSCSDEDIRVWNVDTGECLRVLSDQKNMCVWSITVLHGNIIGTTDLDMKIRVWDVGVGELVRVIETDAKPRTNVFSLEDGTVSVIACGEKETNTALYTWNVSTGEKLKQLALNGAFFLALIK